MLFSSNSSRRGWSLATATALTLVAGRLFVPLAPAGAVGGSYTVLSAADTADAAPGDGICLTGPTAGSTCTLRAAIEEANRDGIASTIGFAIAGTGPYTIALTGNLPALSAGDTTIDGYTQPMSAPNTDPLVSNAKILVQIAGTGSGGPEGINIRSDGNVVRGLAIYNTRSPVFISGGSDNLVVGNFLGTNAAGTFANRVKNDNSFGVVIDNPTIGNHGDRNQIGRAGAADRNVISGNSGRGVYLNNYVVDNVIQNNIVGLNPMGTAALPNASHGIDVNGGGFRTLIGGTGPQDGNLISGNDHHGIEISHNPGASTIANQAIGNRVGTDPSGNTGPAYARNGETYLGANVHLEDHVEATVVAGNIIGNGRYGGIKVDSGSFKSAIRNNRVGISANGTPIPNGEYGIQVEVGSRDNVIGPGNEIAFNANGIRLQDADTVQNTITRNSIHDNDGLGIDIAPLGQVNPNDAGDADTGANEMQNFPVITGVTGSTVSGTACAGCTVEVFRSDGPAGAYGEGRVYLGSATAAGDGTFSAPIPANSTGPYTATATSPTGNTSEFSLNVAPSSK